MGVPLPQTIDALSRAAFDELQVGHLAAAVEVHEVVEDGLADARWDFRWNFDQDVVVQAQYRMPTGQIEEQLLPFAVLLERALEVEVLDLRSAAYQGLSFAAAARVHHQDPLPAGLLLPPGAGLHALVGCVADYRGLAALPHSRRRTVPGFKGAGTVGAALVVALQRTELDGRKARFRTARQQLGFSQQAGGASPDEQAHAAAVLHAYWAAPATADASVPVRTAWIIDLPAHGEPRTLFHRVSPQPGEHRRRGQVNQRLLTELEEEAYGGRRGDQRSAPLHAADGQADADEWTARVEDRLVVEQALSALEGRDAEIARRAYVLNQRQAEIARALGISQPAVHQALTRIAARLRSQFGL
jgi:RNA polymerase sigma factor (sigma-70 family)